MVRSCDMEDDKSQKTVFVGLSGGVDSSVAAKRLFDQGYNVVGVFIKVWHPQWMVCNWEQERLDAMRVAAHLEIPFLTCDAEEAYRDDVAMYFIEEYKAGRTPNPDVMCNQYVKFGRFLEWAKSKGADYIATGHYAQRLDNNDDVELHRGVDTGKDQTYFLWTLSKEQLEYTLFPVGNTPKDKIRAEAEAAGVPVAAKKDSQGICFLGHVDIADFLSHYTELKSGDILDVDGNVIGSHVGALVYTEGQRHGFTINTQDTDKTPHYVISRDLEKNTVTVATNMQAGSEGKFINLTDCVLRKPIEVGETIEYQIRYRQTPLEAEILEVTSNTLTLKPLADNPAPAKGQSCVVYRGTLCIGGGIIG